MLAGMKKLPYLCTRKRDKDTLTLSGFSLTLALRKENRSLK